MLCFSKTFRSQNRAASIIETCWKNNNDLHLQRNKGFFLNNTVLLNLESGQRWGGGRDSGGRHGLCRIVNDG